MADIILDTMLIGFKENEPTRRHSEIVNAIGISIQESVCPFHFLLTSIVELCREEIDF